MQIIVSIMSMSIACFATEFSLTTVKPAVFIKDFTLESTLQKIFLNAFSTAYKSCWSEIEKSQLDFYADTIALFKKEKNMLLIVAQTGLTVAGWALFHKNNKHEVRLEVICIDPAFWRQGLGKKLVFSIIKYWSDVTTIVVSTRMINTLSPQFYESLGFKKTAGITTSEYAPEGLQNFEWKKIC